MIRYATICSGIGAPEFAWMRLGWEGVFCAEIDSFCREVLEARHPGIPNIGDIMSETFIQWCREHIGRRGLDVLCAGTPCQSFSAAGQHGGLADSRGNLALRFVEIADALDPAVLVWENVPGVLRDRGNAFGCILGRMVGADEPLQHGGRRRSWPSAGVALGPRRAAAWRVLDAQHFGVPQRRRRLFVVAGRLGGRIDPVAVLLEPQGVCGHPPPRLGEEADFARDDAARPGNRGEIAACLNSGGHDGGFRTEPGEHLVAYRVTTRTGRCLDPSTDPILVTGLRVRRLTPRECERLMGFPDDFTLLRRDRENSNWWTLSKRESEEMIAYWGVTEDGAPFMSSDTARYMALGNSMVVPVIDWIGRRIQEALT
jgi:DNA (cytosine-5)-methyltransferase 1